MENIYEEFRQRLAALAEPDYAKFMSSLMPDTDNVLGVRLPMVRKLAKELARSGWREYFKLNEDVYFEETMLQGMTIGYLKEDTEILLKEIRAFVPKILNWALCDSFCGGLKFTLKNKKMIWEFLDEYVNSDKPYYVRFAVVMMLEYYIDEDYIGGVFERLNGIRNNDYYVKMAAAWTVSACYSRMPEKTMCFLKDNRLDDFTYNKSLQKICESLKTSQEEKTLIKSMKR